MKSSIKFTMCRSTSGPVVAIAAVFLFLSASVMGQKDNDDIIIGKYRKLHSSITNEDRTLLVCLPRSYQESNLSYPVIYLLYGQNITGYLLPTITACEMLAASGKIPEMIIVGVANAERYRDYSSLSGGNIENSVKFFRDELFPFINTNYRTKDYRVVIGPQAGAVFSFYTLMIYPELFHSFVLENPFYNQNREALFNMADSCFVAGKILDRFLYISEENNSNPASLEKVNSFSEMMKSRMPQHFRFYLNLKEPSGYFVPPVPAKEGFQKLFEGFAFPDSIKVKNVNEIKDFYFRVSQNYGTELQPPEIILTFKSDELISARRFTEANDLLEYQLSLYPRSLNALMRIAGLNVTSGNYEAAIRYYDEFLKIMPSDAIAIRNRRNNVEKYIKESLVYKLEKDILSAGIDQAVRNFNRSRSSKENKLTFTENDLNTLGYALLLRGKQAESIKIFRLGTETFPESANLFDSLGEAYMNSGDNKRAVECYEKSLQLDPGNDNAKKKIEQLRRR